MLLSLQNYNLIITRGCLLEVLLCSLIPKGAFIVDFAIYNLFSVFCAYFRDVTEAFNFLVETIFDQLSNSLFNSSLNVNFSCRIRSWKRHSD